MRETVEFVVKRVIKPLLKDWMYLVIDGFVAVHVLLAAEDLVHAALHLHLVAAVGREVHRPGAVHALGVDREG